MLDRLRQNVAVKELLQSAGRPLMRKTASVPNFSHVSTVCPAAAIASYHLSHEQVIETVRKTVIMCLVLLRFDESEYMYMKLYPVHPSNFLFKKALQPQFYCTLTIINIISSHIYLQLLPIW